MKTKLKLFYLVLFSTVLTVVTTAFTSSKTEKTPANKNAEATTYYVYVTSSCHENGNIHNDLAYVSNVFTIVEKYGSISKYAVILQYKDEFRARHGKEKMDECFSTTVWPYTSKVEAEKKRRSAISDYIADDYKVRYFNKFEYFKE